MPENFHLTGVRVNCICPTSVATQFVADNVNPERLLHVYADKLQKGLVNLQLLK